MPTSEEVGRAIYGVNDIAMAWYALLHRDEAGAPGVITVTPTGASFGSGTILILGIVVLGVVLIARSK